MAKHEKLLLPILRDWKDIDPKVIAGFASSVTVGAIITAGAAVGIDVPVWLASAIVIAVYFAASYWTKTKVPVADNSGLSAQNRALAEAASTVGDELEEGDLRSALSAAFVAAGHRLNDKGEVIDPELIPAPTENKLTD